MPNSIRLSIGTASILKFAQCRLDVKPTTAYTMVHSKTRCSANCAFCAQARGSSASANRLSRITWPSFDLHQVIETIQNTKSTLPFKRICVQTVCYPNLVNDLIQLISEFRLHLPNLPLSLALPPLEKEHFKTLFNLGVDRIAIALDASTPALFKAHKGLGVKSPFTWFEHYQALQSARSVFGKGRTTTHLMIGLGETEIQSVNLIQELTNQGITIGLFPFTPISGTPLSKRSRPSINHYRRIQLAHFLIQNHLIHSDQMKFNSSNRLVNFGLSSETLADIIAQGKAFQTAGCPSCNRPFFTEQPRGPLYNYPLPPNDIAIKKIQHQLAGAP